MVQDDLSKEDKKIEETLKFEDAMRKLEEVVSKLERGELPLEESLKLFEEGIRLTKLCQHELDQAERKVEILLRDEGGALKREELKIPSLEEES